MRTRRGWAIACCVLFVLLVPRESAAFWNWIYELSGPRMMGLGYNCKPFGLFPFAPKKRRTWVITTSSAHGLASDDVVNIVDGNIEHILTDDTDGGYSVTKISDTEFSISVDPAPKVKALVKQGGNSEGASIISVAGLSFGFDRCFKGSTNSFEDLHRSHFWFRYEGAFLFWLYPSFPTNELR